MLQFSECEAFQPTGGGLVPVPLAPQCWPRTGQSPPDSCTTQPTTDIGSRKVAPSGRAAVIPGWLTIRSSGNSRRRHDGHGSIQSEGTAARCMIFHLKPARLESTTNNPRSKTAKRNQCRSRGRYVIIRAESAIIPVRLELCSAVGRPAANQWPHDE